jgi:hypothetical protein
LENVTLSFEELRYLPLSFALLGLLRRTRKGRFRVQEHNLCLRLCKLEKLPVSVAL